MISAELRQHPESYVAQPVESGCDNPESEVLPEGTRLIHHRETQRTALNASLLRGIENADCGLTKPTRKCSTNWGRKTSRSWSGRSDCSDQRSRA